MLFCRARQNISLSVLTWHHSDVEVVALQGVRPRRRGGLLPLYPRVRDRLEPPDTTFSASLYRAASSPSPSPPPLPRLLACARRVWMSQPRALPLRASRASVPSVCALTSCPVSLPPAPPPAAPPPCTVAGGRATRGRTAKTWRRWPWPGGWRRTRRSGRTSCSGGWPRRCWRPAWTR